MNCRDAETLLHAERDHALGAEQQAQLEQHLGVCADCRRTQSLLTESAEAWRETSSNVAVPDPQSEWHKLRRRIRTGGAGRGIGFRKHIGWITSGLAVGAAAAIVLLPIMREPGGVTDRQLFARVESVEIADTHASPVVFVDEDTGWLVVWSVPEAPASKS